MGALEQTVQPSPAGDLEQIRDILFGIESLTTPQTTSYGAHKVHFTLDGLHVEVGQTQSGTESLVSIRAFIGYLPFSIQSQEKRNAVLQIMAEASSKLFTKFELDKSGRVYAKGFFAKDVDRAPDFIFYPLIMFLQEARPFINLLGQYVSP